MPDSFKKFQLLFAFGGALIVVSVFFGPLVLHPEHGIMALGADGLKNMYNYLQECCFGTGVWYYGMNYPYGEHMVYTDGIPLISVIFAKAGHVTQDNALRCLWWTIALSWALAILYVYRILDHFKVPFFRAFLFACLITLMSPQYVRLLPHYSLSYACVIPMLIFRTLRYEADGNKWHAFRIFLLGIVMSMVHPYYALMILIWVLAWSMGHLLSGGGNAVTRLFWALPLVVAGIAEIAFFKVFMWLTDPYTDRALQPFGFMEYKTRIKELVTSQQSWIWNFVTRAHLFKMTDQYGEGTAYLGIAVIVLALGGFGCMVVRLVARKQRTARVLPAGFSPALAFTGISILLFSMGVPFRFHMEWLADVVPVFRQFRSLGRFDWMFYFVAAIYAVVVAERVYVTRRDAGKPLFAGIFLVMVTTLWISEAAGAVGFVWANEAQAEKNYSESLGLKGPEWERWLGDAGYPPAQFQAVLSLGIVNIGTEKYWIGDNSMGGLTEAEIAGLRLHLPIMDANLSRISWEVSRKQTKIAAGPFAEKEVLRDLRSDKPILVLHKTDEPLRPEESYVLSASKYIGQLHHCQAFALYPRQLAAMDKKLQDSAMAIAGLMKTGDTCIGNNSNVYIDHFDKYRSANSRFGGGALAKTKDTILARIPITVPDTQEYEFSAWFLTDSTNWATPVLHLYFYGSNGQLIGIMGLYGSLSTDREGLWTRAGDYFRFPAGVVSIVCAVQYQQMKDYVLKDEVLLRPAKGLVISRLTDGKIMANNHLLHQ